MEWCVEERGSRFESSLQDPSLQDRWLRDGSLKDGWLQDGSLQDGWLRDPSLRTEPYDCKDGAVAYACAVRGMDAR